MKKLLALVALIGMGAFIGGCGGDEAKTTPTKPPASHAMSGPGAMHAGPKADAGDKKDGDDKDMDKDGDKGDADKDADKTDGDDKPKEE
jgi:hypothetical protein